MRLSRLVTFITITAAIAAIGTVGWWIVRDYGSSLILNTDTELEDDVYEVAEVVMDIVAPPPLRGQTDQTAGTLTQSGVLSETNRHRAINGLGSLVINTYLNQAATNKLNDMFAKQYFEHVSPDGMGPADVVNSAGYSFVRVGENLALGNFRSDADLVQAWMDSPGHRANILSKGFIEIGIAVGKGTFEGKSVWMAVQTFGTPKDVCPQPDKDLKEAFDAKTFEAETLQNTLAEMDTDIAQAEFTIEELNGEVNNLVSEGNRKIKDGNTAVQHGNDIYNETGSKEQAQPHWEKGEQLQEEGRKLHDQARAKKEQLPPEQQRLINLQNTYAQTVDKLRSLNEEINTTGSRYNDQARAYNKCVKRYTD